MKRNCKCQKKQFRRNFDEFRNFVSLYFLLSIFNGLPNSFNNSLS
eukprot:UN24897